MFAHLIETIGSWFDRNEQRQLNRYLEGSADLAEVERRMRSYNSREFASIFMLMDLLAPRYPGMDMPLDSDYSYEARHAEYERQHAFGIHHAWHRN
jgi:hypothetical protein